MNTLWHLGVDLGSVRIEVIAPAPRTEHPYWVRSTRDRSVDVLAERLKAEISQSIGKERVCLAVVGVGKIAHFIDCKVQGLIDTVAVHCMLGVVIDSAVPLSRRTHPAVPVITLTYERLENARQHNRLDRFVHTVPKRSNPIEAMPKARHRKWRHPEKDDQVSSLATLSAGQTLAAKRELCLTRTVRHCVKMNEGYSV